MNSCVQSLSVVCMSILFSGCVLLLGHVHLRPAVILRVGAHSVNGSRKHVPILSHVRAIFLYFFHVPVSFFRPTHSGQDGAVCTESQLHDRSLSLLLRTERERADKRQRKTSRESEREKYERREEKRREEERRGEKRERDTKERLLSVCVQHAPVCTFNTPVSHVTRERFERTHGIVFQCKTRRNTHNHTQPQRGV